MYRGVLALAFTVVLTATVVAPTFAQGPPTTAGQPHDYGMPHGAGGPAQQHGAPAADASLPHHVLVQTYEKAFAENIATGRGFGMAFVADQNGYPGPLHVLELKDRLKLTADQEAKIQTMLTAMFAESRPRSARLLDGEAKLRRLFATSHADETSVRAAVAEIENARAEVRLVHLTFHLKTRDVLTDEQRRLYHEARWGASGTMRLHDGGSRGPHAPLK